MGQGFRVLGFGLRVLGVGFSVSGFRFRVLGVGFSVLGFGVLFYRVECLMFKVFGGGFWV